MTVHSILPEPLARAAGAELAAAGVPHVAHGTGDPVAAAEAAVADPETLALLGPYRSAAVAEAVEVSGPAGLALLAPVATWAGVTRDDEPGCDDPARHGGTVLRLVARDTEVARRLADHVRDSGRRALVLAGSHEYGRQIDGQLRLAGLPRAEGAGDADLVVFAGFPGEPEVSVAAESAPLPLIAFDGAQGAHLGERTIHVALPHAPIEGVPTRELMAGVEQARRAAQLVIGALDDGAADRKAVLATVRRIGRFDEHGDPLDPPVWLWCADSDWDLYPDQPL